MVISMKDYLEKGCSNLSAVCSLYVNEEGRILDTSGKSSDDFFKEICDIHKKLGISYEFEEIVKEDQWHYGEYELETNNGKTYVISNTSFVKKGMVEKVDGMFI